MKKLEHFYNHLQLFTNFGRFRAVIICRITMIKHRLSFLNLRFSLNAVKQSDPYSMHPFQSVELQPNVINSKNIHTFLRG